MDIAHRSSEPILSINKSALEDVLHIDEYWYSLIDRKLSRYAIEVMGLDQQQDWIGVTESTLLKRMRRVFEGRLHTPLDAQRAELPSEGGEG